MGHANRIEVGRRIEGAAGWLLLLALVVAPWWYGSTRLEAIWGLGALLVATGFIGSVGFLCKGRMPQVPYTCMAAVLLVVILGWVLVPRAAEHALSPAMLELVSWHLHRWPASTTVRPPAALALLATGLGATLLLAADLARDPIWRRRLLMTMVFTGASVAALGIFQVMTGVEGVFDESRYGDLRDVMPGHFFATFFHHSVAGAFLNLVWPLGLALFFFRQWADAGHRNRLADASLVLCAGVVLVAVIVNVSKAGMLFAALLLIGFTIFPGFHFFRSLRGGQRAGLLAVVALFCAAVGFIGVETGRLELAQKRWQDWYSTVASLPAEVQRTGAIPTEPPFDRFAAARVSIEMAREGGFWGFGPGAWMRTFPEFTGETEFEPFWLWMQFAHQDYLQTLVEWGPVGALLCGFLVIGGLWRLVRAIRHTRWDIWSTEALVLYGILISLVALLLHAAGDFPLQIPSIQLYAAVLFGFCWSAPRWRPEESAVMAGSRRRDNAPRPKPRTGLRIRGMNTFV